MIEVRQTDEFSAWIKALRDANARARIVNRMRRLAAGNPGDVKPVGSGVSEMRIDYGPGYRVYFVQRGDVLVILLCGGDKRTQEKGHRYDQGARRGSGGLTWQPRPPNSTRRTTSTPPRMSSPTSKPPSRMATLRSSP
ncbi:type II toxin-antitoxin system RelE/ParE family toxin [Xanthobacter autotrophicus]|uniref:type II toxin-antitoxin system RelE/ParE family toxin n=1 Tax=Xanthobacter autotrophicus TaxID=280 RepID=UPI0032C14357